jgi:hypothetical protein
MRARLKVLPGLRMVTAAQQRTIHAACGQLKRTVEGRGYPSIGFGRPFISEWTGSGCAFHRCPEVPAFPGNATSVPGRELEEAYFLNFDESPANGVS